VGFMVKRLPTFFEKNAEPASHRVAVGLHKLGLAMKHQAWAKGNAEGISPTQGQILAAIGAEGPLTGSELASRLAISLPTVSDSVRVLVEKALLEKQADPRHPRASLLALTTTGKVLARKVSGWPDFLATAVSELTEPEQHGMLLSMVKMLRSLQKQGMIPVSRMCVSCTFFEPNVHKGLSPHHCRFVDSPLEDAQLRVDCPEFEAASESAQSEVWKRFIAV
jgi:DNA-binding MarR family transcriptional regulator